MSRPRLLVGHLNLWTGNPRRAAAVELMLGRRYGRRPDSLGLNEAYGFLPRLERVDGYRLVVDSGDHKRRGANDVPVLVRDDHRSLGELTLRASEQTTPARVAPDRWITVAMYDAAVGPVAHVCLHPNAGPKALRGRDGDVPLVREYGRSMEALDDVLTLLRARGFRLVLTGDLNLTLEAPRRSWSPFYVLEDHGLTVYGRGVDFAAHDRHLRPRRALTVVPSSRTGSDHPGLILDLEAVR